MLWGGRLLFFNIRGEWLAHGLGPVAASFSGSRSNSNAELFRDIEIELRASAEQKL